MKDGKFKVGDEVEYVELEFNAWITIGNKYTVKNIWNEAVCPSIQIVNDSGIDTLYPAHLFKLAEPAFVHEYFSALNEKDAEKYIGKIMEFADRSFMLNNKWTQGKYSGLNSNKNSSCAFKSENSDGIFYQFMRTCPETFIKKKVKRTVERWVNIYKNGDEHSYRYFEDAMADRDDIGYIACVHLIKEYDIEE